VPAAGLVPAPESARIQGDCINCYRCVNVCPTGIDIRRGSQLECVGCAACVDACDDVMARLKKPLGLIRYDSFAGMNGIKGERVGLRYLLYGLVISLVAVIFAAVIFIREPIQVTFLRAIDTPYQDVIGADGVEMIVNHYKFEANNQTEKPVKIEIGLADEWIAKGIELVSVKSVLNLAGGGRERGDVFLRTPKGLFVAGALKIKVLWTATGEKISKPIKKIQEIPIVGPLR